ncbi:response regulator transcription factor [Mariniluteicoccus endophyticus]
MSPNVLIIEDEAAIAAFIAKGLAREQLGSTSAQNGARGIELATTGRFDLVVLDLGLPDMDGFDVLARLNHDLPDLPVIILTARSSVPDTVAGLQKGAVDYMAKPFSVEELLARIQLRLRKEPSPADQLVLTHGSLSLDVRTRRATVDGREVELTAREFTLAEAFLRSPGEVLSREQLLSRVWGYEFDPGSNVVEVYMRYLRRKLGAERFVTVRGVGYRLA